jgi:Family of unknown function (DUF6535)
MDKPITNGNHPELRRSAENSASYGQSAFPKESTIWDVYVNEAKGVDKELVDEWRSSLNFLLVFVSPLSSLIFQN